MISSSTRCSKPEAGRGLQASSLELRVPSPKQDPRRLQPPLMSPRPPGAPRKTEREVRNAECGMRSEKGAERYGKCGTRNAECGVRRVRSDRGSGERGLRNAE